MNGSGARLFTRALADRLATQFWLLPAVAITLAVAGGLLLPVLDAELGLGDVIGDPRNARAVLQAVAGGMLGVAGVAFSVTVVALQLASQQLSPRVLRTFQSDRLAQAVLALLLATSVMALLVLAHIRGGSTPFVPSISSVCVLVLALVSVLLFVAFIHDIVISLQASTLIRRIASDGERVTAPLYPGGVGQEPDDAEHAGERARAMADAEPLCVRTERAGYLADVRGGNVMNLAERHDVLVRQRVRIGEFVLSGQPLAEVFGGSDDDRRTVAGKLEGAFVVRQERRAVSDPGFPLRQLVDVALRALSPSLNDPTTAENAMNSVAELLLLLARAEHPSPIRVDGSGEPRFAAVVPDYDELVHVGFDQVRQAANPHPLLVARLLDLLGHLHAAAQSEGRSRVEIERQRQLLRARSFGEDPESSPVR